MRKVLFFILVILPLGLFAQFNTDRLMVTGRSALFMKTMYFPYSISTRLSMSSHIFTTHGFQRGR